MTLHTASSEPFTVYAAGPQNAHAGVVLVHDWFGISRSIRKQRKSWPNEAIACWPSTFTADAVRRRTIKRANFSSRCETMSQQEKLMQRSGNSPKAVDQSP
jgi:dienelactone hydrolase